MKDPTHKPWEAGYDSSLSPSSAPQAIQLDFLFDPTKRSTLADRIMARLLQAEAHEANPHFRDDYRQAFITVSFASKGNTEPFLTASYSMYGVHPDKVWPKIVAVRQAKLAAEYPLFYDESGNLRKDSPIPDYDPTSLPHVLTSALVAETGAAQSPLRPTATAPVPKKGKVA